jgi:ATP-dependent Zn protease
VVKTKRVSKNSLPSRDLLGRAFLDILARDAGSVSRPLLRSGDPNDPIERLLDDLSALGPGSTRISIRADLAAAAVLTARAIETDPSVLRDLRRGTPVITIATHGPEIVSLVNDVITTCAFGPDTSVEQNKVSTKRERSAVVITRDGTEDDHKPDEGNDLIAAAIHARCPIIGIATDPRRHLPRDLMRAAECHLSIGQIDAAAIALVIEAVTGKAPDGAIDPDLVRSADVADLQLALRYDRSPDECLRRLSELVKTRGLLDGDGPRLEELAGYGEARRLGLELVADLADYRKGNLDWASVETKGLLLAGPPGVGKTQYAMALARSARVPIVATSVADWHAASYLSGTLQAMQTDFSQARRLAPAILFIDELDGISDRSTLRGDHVEYWSQIVNLLLELLAGVEDRPGVVVIGATNHPNKIDAAVRRAGRLDRTIVIQKPGVEDLVAIFRFHLKDTLSGADLVPAALAARGGTGADVEAWVRRAKAKARRQRRDLVLDDLLHEIRGLRDPIPPALRRASAIHESGHVVAGTVLGSFELHAVSLHDAGGATSVTLKIENSQTLRGLESFIAVLLAGRAAEELVFGPDEICAGAGGGEDSDLARATRIALDIETKLGLGFFGSMRLPQTAIDFMIQDARMIGVVKKRLDGCFDLARRILAVNKTALLAVANELEAHGYLDKSDIDALFARHPPQAPPMAPRVAGRAEARRTLRQCHECRAADGGSRTGRTRRRSFR